MHEASLVQFELLQSLTDKTENQNEVKWRKENILKVLYCSAIFFSFQDTVEETECISHIFIVLSKNEYLFCGKITCGLNFVLLLWTEIMLLIFSR